MDVPDGMREVSKDEFYAAMGPLDVHPSVANPEYTVWELRDRTVVGRSYPGWRRPCGERRYFLP